MSERTYAVYILASARNGTLYIGVTNNLSLRVFQHRAGTGSEFTATHKVKRLVCYEYYTDVREAIAREKQLKKWERKWTLKLIEDFNPGWVDMYELLNQ
jgi:putative endonuclease